MLVCPKCLKEFGDGSKICRDCGAILNHVEAAEIQDSHETEAEQEVSLAIPEESAFVFQERPHEPLDVEWEETPWKCPKCQEAIEANFESCWNCGTNRDGTEDPDFISLWDGSVEPASQTEPPLPAVPHGDPCEKCGSSKVIPNAILGDQGQYSDGKLKVHVIGNPNAWVFKDVKRSELRANVCGECGHVELFVTNPSALYEHYLRTVEVSQADNDHD